MKRFDWKVVGLVLIMAIIYALIVAPNHYLFRTYALDLGAYTSALYDYAHFQWNDSTVFKDAPENLLADHFDLYLIIFSPLSIFFGNITLLVVQIVFVLLGGIGVYKYLQSSPETKRFSIYGMASFYLFFGVFGALSFDYHSNVVAACVLPWFMIQLRREKFVPAALLLLFMLIGKENMSLWLGFVCLALLIEYRHHINKRRFLLVSTAVSFIYFVLVLKVFMPAFANNGTYPHFHYSAIGNDMTEAIIHLITHPIESIQTLFVNHTNNPKGDFVKMELHILLLLSGLPLLLFRPLYLIMLIPIYFQKLFHDNPSMWGVGVQYNIEFAPIFAIGVFEGIAKIKNEKLIRIFAPLTLILTLVATFKSMDRTYAKTNKASFRLYQSIHYTRDYDTQLIYDAIEKIPDEVAVSALTPILPHLAYRDKIYQFPLIYDAEYIIYTDKEQLYPMEGNEFYEITAELESSPTWEIVIKNETVTLLKRVIIE